MSGQRIKVFSLNDYEWWAGTDLESVKADYLRQTGLSGEEAFDEPCELTDGQMNRLRVWDGERKNDVTFAESLRQMIENGVEFPCFFASTEC